MITEYINLHYTEILNKFKAITRNHQDTQDLLQDCILNFLEKGNDYTKQVLQDGKVQHYLIRMGHIQFNYLPHHSILNTRNPLLKQRKSTKSW